MHHYSGRFTPSYISFDAAILLISVTIDSDSSKANTHADMGLSREHYILIITPPTDAQTMLSSKLRKNRCRCCRCEYVCRRCYIVGHRLHYLTTTKRMVK